MANDLLDGSVHQDTVAQTVTRGSLVYANSTPKWDELVIGGARSYLGSNGTDPAWAQTFAYTLLADGANVDNTGNTNENTVKTLTIPAAAIGANGCLMILIACVGTGAGGTKTVRLKLGGTQLFSEPIATNAYTILVQLFNRNAQDSQYLCFVGLLSSDETGTRTGNNEVNMHNTFAIDTSAEQSLIITAQNASAGDTISIRGFYVQIVR